MITNAFDLATNTIGSGIDITNVTVGGKAVTALLGQGTNWVSFTVPPGDAPGEVDLAVYSTSKGLNLMSSSYTYNPTGVIVSVSPTSGVAGTEVTITGEGLGDGTDITNVTFGAASATVLSQSTTQVVVTAPAGSGVVDVQTYSTNFGLASMSGAFTYEGSGPEDQTIDFPPIGDQWTTNRVGLSATASSGLTVTFTTNGGPALIDGTNLTFTGTGTVSIVASQAGDANWNAAPPKTNTFTVTAAAVNHAPVGTANTVTTLEDTSYAFSVADFGFTDPNDSPANAFAAVKITTLPSAGTLTSGGMAVTNGQWIITSAGATWTARASYGKWFSMASSADGTKLIAGNYNGQLYTSTDSGANWTAHESNRSWRALASSADGTKLVAAIDGGQIYTSTDTGATWTARASSLYWSSVASSADGTKLVAGQQFGRLFTSTDTGATWIARASTQYWSSVASSSDGTKLVAMVNGGQLYTSPDAGATWTARASTQTWISVASSADGTKLVAGTYGGQLYTSTDSGATWTARASTQSWYAVASSADGTKLVAGVDNGQLYTSQGDIDLTFTPATNGYGSPYSSFTFKVQDDGGTANGGVDLDPTPKTMTINVTGVPDDQTITFPAIADQVTTDEIGLAATASSGLDVTFAVASGPASIAGGTNLTFTGAGSVSIVASQAGDVNWNPAPDVTNTFNVLGVYTVTVASAHGTATPVPGAYVHIQGVIITNRVTSPETLGATQYVATGWVMTGHEPATGSDPELVFTVTNSAVLTWLWSTQYWLDVESGPNGSVDVSDGWQAGGSTAEIEALPEVFYGFSHWSGDASGDDNPLSLLMDASKSVTAYFTALYTTNHPTPQWWLAGHGITGDFEDAVREDHDDDTVPTWAEFIMDTDPTNAASFLAVSGMEPLYGTNCWDVVWTNDVPPYEIGTNVECEIIGQLITWPVSTQRIYGVQSADGLFSELWSGMPGLTNITPTTPSLTITNPLTGDVMKLYRITVRLPD